MPLKLSIVSIAIAAMRKHRIRSALLLVLIVAVGFLVHVRVTHFQWCTPNPFKITNPTNPRYNPEDFCLGNYKKEKLREAFRVTFPPGTPKATVDRIMAKSKCRSVQEKNSRAETRYVCPRVFYNPLQFVLLSGTKTTSHLFLYEENSLLINSHPSVAGDKLFSEMSGKHDLDEPEPTNSAEPNFKFGDHTDPDELLRALVDLFPVGTPRTTVEKLLVDREGLIAGFAKADEDSYFVVYSEPNKDAGYHREGLSIAGLRQARFKYDAGDHVETIEAQILTGKSPVKFFFGEPIGKDEKL